MRRRSTLREPTPGRSARRVDPATRAAFETMAVSGRGEAGALAVGLRQEITSVGLRALAAKLLHVAICAPGRMVDVYDSAAHGWLSGQSYSPVTRNMTGEQPPAAFWRSFWRLLDQPLAGRRRKSFTASTAELAGLLEQRINSRVAAAALSFPGMTDAVEARRLERIDLRSLSHMPATSLGGVVYREAVARGQLDLILEPGALLLERLPPPLGYLNARILECHIVWAALAGYSSAELDELALAAFQMGQFGHHYSSLVIALAAATLAFERPVGLEIVLDSIFRGWLHGRETPPLLGVSWSDLWETPIDDVRQRLGVTTFPSPLAAAIAAMPQGGPH